MFTLKAVTVVTGLAILTASSEAQNVSQFVPPNCDAVCMTVVAAKLSAIKRAKVGRYQWRAYWAASEGRLYARLPDGSVYDQSSGEARRFNKPVAIAELNADAQRVIAEWVRAADIAFNYQRQGILTFRQYPCAWDCEGHKAGYSFARHHKVDEYRACPQETLSFYEGCLAYVADYKGEVFPDD